MYTLYISKLESECTSDSVGLVLNPSTVVRRTGLLPLNQPDELFPCIESSATKSSSSGIEATILSKNSNCYLKLFDTFFALINDNWFVSLPGLRRGERF
jgi:hypothetical protein